MANGAPPPAGPAAQKKGRRNTFLVLGLGAAVVVFLVIRSRQQQAAATDPNAAATAALQAAQNQQASDQAAGVGPSTFADNGAQAAALGDAVTQGLSGITQAFNDQAQALAQLQQSQSTAGGTPATSITINNGPGAKAPGQPNKGNGKGAQRPKLTAKGAIYAPFGHNRPPRKQGYHIKGLGHGFWEYLRN